MRFASEGNPGGPAMQTTLLFTRDAGMHDMGRRYTVDLEFSPPGYIIQRSEADFAVHSRYTTNYRPPAPEYAKLLNRLDFA
jgi:hypothetical protein